MQIGWSLWRDKCAYLFHIKFAVCCRRKICDKKNDAKSARDLKYIFHANAAEKNRSQLQQNSSDGKSIKLKQWILM